MNAPIRASDLCIRTLPAEERLLALISGYFDDSRKEGEILVLAGYVAYANQWDHFERLWSEVLAAHGVPYFHMREMAGPNGVFKKWHPPKEHQDEVLVFFKDLVSTIRRCGLQMFASAVWVKDLERLNTEKGIELEPYPLAAYSCLAQIAQKHEISVTAVFDRIEKVDSKLVVARSYAESDRHLFPGLCDLITSVPLAKDLNSRRVPALQAADFIAWETRKLYEKMAPWQSSIDRPFSDREEQWRDYLDWNRETTGSEYPVLRGSLEALIDQTPIKAVVWDYHQLITTHDARRGIWTQEGGG